MQTERMRKVSLHVVLEPEEREFVENLAVRERVSLAQIIRRAVRHFMANEGVNRPMTIDEPPEGRVA